MAKVGAQRAADLTGRSKSTIQRAMNSGKLSYEVDANNRRIIDVSELDRVFGLEAPTAAAPQKSASSVEDELKKAADMIEMERMKMKIKMLEDQLELTNNHLDDMKAQRDQWQKQAQQVLITSQYSQKQAEEYKAELKSREEKARQRREQMMSERMDKMQSHNQNQRPAEKPPVNNTPAQPAEKILRDKPKAEEENIWKSETSKQQDQQTQPASAPAAFDFQNLWQKIRGGKAA